MSDSSVDTNQAAKEFLRAFEREIGVTEVSYAIRQVGERQFLKVKVGRQSALYTHALHAAQQALTPDNPFLGAVGLEIDSEEHPFPNTLEANALLTLLTRSTREVSEGANERGFQVPYIPFQKREDHQLAQAATHIVRGRRGVGKSTLIGRAVAIMLATKSPTVVLDMQSYSTLDEEDLTTEVLSDVCQRFGAMGVSPDHQALTALSSELARGELKLSKAPVAIKRHLAEITKALQQPAFVFLDDLHVIDRAAQPRLLHYLHAATKGANAWLKVAGLSSLLNVYSPKSREGLQVPGDAQIISLDLTLENPEAAEKHLRAILESFLVAVGYLPSQAVIEPAFKRLVWATAGVPRDFLQMFAKALEHAQRNKHVVVTLSDVNSAIGEFGQQKMEDLRRDARNEADVLTKLLERLEKVCLDDKQTNAFLVRSEDSEIRTHVHALSDLRMVHLIHQSITPDKAGERYEAYIIDYSIFTGFRRRPGVKEMVPKEAQFKAAELRALPKVA
jgi:hypothetical protein